MVQNLPAPETYEKEFQYMPWGKLIAEVENFAIKNIPQNGLAVDLMCGPGYLLGKLNKRRPDVKYLGVDLEPEFISYAQKLYPGIDFIIADAFAWESKDKYDAVFCTAGLHHLPYDKQASFILKIASLLKDDGFAIVADPYIDDYSNEVERKLAGAKLGHEYLVATIKNGATDDVIKAAVGILENDVLLVEYKNSIKRTKPILEKHFSNIEMHKIWPSEETEYGDYYFILKK